MENLSFHAEGVAVKSTFKRLKDCFAKTIQRVFVGMVRYIDYKTERMPGGLVFFPALHKRKSFIYENELRVIYWDTDLMIKAYEAGEDVTKKAAPGVSIPVDLTTLIESVRVAPTCPLWLESLVDGVIKKYGLAIPVERSALESEDIW